MKTMCLLVLPLVLTAFAATAGAQASRDAMETMKPFVMPPLAVPEQIDLRRIFTGPRGERLPRVSVRDGHFVASGERVRLWGVNICFGACFPPRDVADALAARLAAFGINIVRLHHMDMKAFPDGIWKADFSGLDEQALDRLDYFMAALKREGIYVNINLHVTRDFTRTGSDAPPEDLPDRGKLICLFNPELIDLQKDYARRLLTHSNAYTGLTYAADPVVAMTEISNENSMLMLLWWNQTQRLPERYERELVAQWNQWLSDRYRDDDALRRAWSPGELARGPDMLRHPDFAEESFDRDWLVSMSNGARMSAATGQDDKGAAAVDLTIERSTGTAGDLQFLQPNLDVEAGQLYTLRFRARAADTTHITVELRSAGDRGRQLGEPMPFRITQAWQSFEGSVVAGADQTGAKLAFIVGQRPGHLQFSNVSFASGGRRGLAPDEALGDGSVRRYMPHDIVTTARIADWVRFLAELDKRYYVGMYDWLKSELGVRSCIAGTAGHTLVGDWVQSHLDVVDGHVYWQHPQFHGRQWDRRNWTIPNTPMVDDPADSALLKLTRSRIAAPEAGAPERPFTVSEYQHPAPSDYQAEGIPMVASFAAAQDWDGVYLFNYTSSRNLPEHDTISGFFDLGGNPMQMAQMAAGALIFRRGDVSALPARVRMELPPERLIALGAESAPWTPWSPGFLGAPQAQAAPGLRFFGRYDIAAWARDRNPRVGPIIEWPSQPKGSSQEMPSVAAINPSDPDVKGPVDWRSAGEVLRWSVQRPGESFYAARGDRSVALVGFIGGATHEVGPVGIAIDTPSFAAVTVSSLDGRSLETSRKMLVTACARVANTEMGWNADRTSVGDQWGRPPTRIEPVTGRLRLATSRKGTCRLVALDGSGRPLAQRSVTMDGETELPLASDPATVWYLLDIGDADN